MGSKVFQISGYVSNPLFYKCAYKTLTPTKLCRHPGINAELLGYTLSNMKQPYKVITKTQRKKKFSTSQKAINAGFVATSSGMYVITESRMKDFDFSYPVSQMKPVFMVAKRTRSFLENALLPMKAFNEYVWWSILFTLLCLILALFLYRNFRKYNQQGNKFVDFLTVGLAKSFHRGDEPTMAGNMIALFLGLTTFFITTLYCGCLLTSLLHPPKITPFRDSWQILELVDQNKLHIIVAGTTGWFMNEMNYSNISYYKRLREVTVNNPIQVIKGLDERVKALETGPYVYAVIHSGKTEEIVRKNCNLTLVQGNDLPTYWVAFLFKKNSTWVRSFNEALIATRNGIDAIMEKYLTVSSQCTHERRLGGTPLSIRSVAGCGSFLIIGCFIALVVFVMERFAKLKLRSPGPAQKRPKQREIMVLPAPAHRVKRRRHKLIITDVD